MPLRRRLVSSIGLWVDPFKGMLLASAQIILTESTRVPAMIRNFPFGTFYYRGRAVLVYSCENSGDRIFQLVGARNGRGRATTLPHARRCCDRTTAASRLARCLPMSQGYISGPTSCVVGQKGRPPLAMFTSIRCRHRPVKVKGNPVTIRGRGICPTGRGICPIRARFKPLVRVRFPNVDER